MRPDICARTERAYDEAAGLLATGAGTTVSRAGKGRCCVRSEAENEQHGRRRGVFQRRIVLHDERRLPRASQNGDVLLAVHRITDGRRIDAGADAKAPSLLQGLGVVCGEGSVWLAEEDEIARGGERTGIVREIEPHGGLDISGGRIDGLEA